jgi:nicotinamide-nucleotide adenylyltransferase
MRVAKGHENDSLLIGRFQPFHKGHMEVVRKIAEESDHLTIGIGSAQYSHTLENPFTAGERYLMIAESLRAEGIKDFFIVPIEDLNRYSVWVSQVVSIAPPFVRVYTNNPLTRRLFLEADFEVRASPLFNRSEYSGTEIRKRMTEGDGWRRLVPKEVAGIIDGIDGIGRMRALLGEKDGL